ncbi:MAG: hypothetical protein JJU19_06015 [Pararhodobacter sp.]|nr:hypothetical protein [Pararhodobacter sp.]
MILRALLLSLVGLALPVMGHADALARASLAGLSGSERLRQFSIGQALLQHRGDPRIARAMQASLQQSGFYHTGSGPSVLSRSVRIDPVLAYDANINGGFLNDRFDIFGLSFDVDPTRRALPGVVGGALGSGQMRLAYAEGRYLDLRGSVEAVYSPQHRIGRGRAGFEGCARNHLQGWSFADLCVTAARSWRRLSTSTTSGVSLSFARLHAANASEHEFTTGVTRSFLNGTPQDSVSMGWKAVWNRAVTSLELTMAAPIAGETAMRQRVQGSVGWLWQGRPVRMGMWHQRAAGGMLLGVARTDRVSGISLSAQARPNMTVEVMHQVTRSSVSLFDENRIGVNLRFDLSRR